MVCPEDECTCGSTWAPQGTPRPDLSRFGGLVAVVAYVRKELGYK